MTERFYPFINRHKLKSIVSGRSHHRPRHEAMLLYLITREKVHVSFLATLFMKWHQSTGTKKRNVVRRDLPGSFMHDG